MRQSPVAANADNRMSSQCPGMESQQVSFVLLGIGLALGGDTLHVQGIERITPSGSVFPCQTSRLLVRETVCSIGVIVFDLMCVGRLRGSLTEMRCTHQNKLGPAIAGFCLLFFVLAVSATNSQASSDVASVSHDRPYRILVVVEKRGDPNGVVVNTNKD